MKRSELARGIMALFSCMYGQMEQSRNRPMVYQRKSKILWYFNLYIHSNRPRENIKLISFFVLYVIIITSDIAM